MEYCSRIVLVDKGVEVFGPEAKELIKLIDTQKSIKGAAATMKISTARAWKYIRAIEKAIGEGAIVKNNRGADSYNVHISPACRNLLEKYESFEKQCQGAAEEYFKQIF